MVWFLGIGLVLWIAFRWRIHWREREIEATYPPSGQFVTIDGVTTHYVEKGQGQPVILLHGASGNLREFTFAFMDLLKDRYRVIAVDRPGFGFSDVLDQNDILPLGVKVKSPMDQGAFLAKFAAAIDAPKPIVVGHSFGGAVALGWALAAPNSLGGLVLAASPSNPWTTSLGLYYRVNGSKWGGFFMPPILTAIVGKGKVSRTIDEIFEPHPAPVGYQDHVGADLVLRRRVLRINARQVMGLLDHIKRMVPQYPSIKVPCAILHGDADTIVPIDIHSEKLIHQLPNATLHVMKGVGHMPHHEDPKAVIAAIDDIAAKATLNQGA